MNLKSYQADYIELFHQISNETEINYQNGILQGINQTQTGGYSARVIKGNKTGFSTASNCFHPDVAINKAIELSQYRDEFSINVSSNRKSGKYQSLTPENKLPETREAIDKLNLYNELLRKKLPDYVVGLNCNLSNDFCTIKDSNLIECELSVLSASMFVQVHRSRENDLYEWYLTFDGIPTEKEFLARLDKFLQEVQNGQTIIDCPSGKYDVIFTPNMYPGLISSLIDGLSGSSLFTGSSPLKNRIHERILNPLFSLYEEPTGENWYYQFPCDDEGVSLINHPLIENGKLNSYLINQEYATRLHCESTGNGYRRGLMSGLRSYRNLPCCDFSNLRIGNGNTSVESMIKNLDSGLILEFSPDIWMGNLANGDFSGQIRMGYLVEKGEIKGRIKNKSVRGNIYNLFNDQIQEISQETEKSFQNSRFCAPFISATKVMIN